MCVIYIKAVIVLFDAVVKELTQVITEKASSGVCVGKTET